MLRPEYPLPTARLELRPFTVADFDDLYAIRSRSDVTRYLYAEPEGPAEVRDVLDRKIGESTLDRAGQAISLAVVWPHIGRVIGEVHLEWLSREHRQGEIGFVINPDHHGNGFATEAADAALRLGFDGLGLHRIIARLDSRNLGSARVLESSACGARRTSYTTRSSRASGATRSSTQSSTTNGTHGTEGQCGSTRHPDFPRRLPHLPLR